MSLQRLQDTSHPSDRKRPPRAGRMQRARPHSGSLYPQRSIHDGISKSMQVSRTRAKGPERQPARETALHGELRTFAGNRARLNISFGCLYGYRMLSRCAHAAYVASARQLGDGTTTPAEIA